MKPELREDPCSPREKDMVRATDAVPPPDARSLRPTREPWASVAGRRRARIWGRQARRRRAGGGTPHVPSVRPNGVGLSPGAMGELPREIPLHRDGGRRRSGAHLLRPAVLLGSARAVDKRRPADHPRARRGRERVPVRRKLSAREHRRVRAFRWKKTTSPKTRAATAWRKRGSRRRGDRRAGGGESGWSITICSQVPADPEPPRRGDAGSRGSAEAAQATPSGFSAAMALASSATRAR